MNTWTVDLHALHIHEALEKLAEHFYLFNQLPCRPQALSCHNQPSCTTVLLLFCCPAITRCTCGGLARGNLGCDQLLTATPSLRSRLQPRR